MALNAIPGFRCVVLCGVVGGFQVLLGFWCGGGFAAGVGGAQRDGSGCHHDLRPHPRPINPPATKLLPEFRQNGGRYFNTDERDFVAVYSR
jgi:hypothetical protein